MDDQERDVSAVGSAGTEAADPRALSSNQVDKGKIESDQLAQQLAGMPDTRNSITYTFKGTGEESFLHSLPYKPEGVIIAGQTKGGVVSFNSDKTKNRRAYMTSSVANNKVTLIFY